MVKNPPANTGDKRLKFDPRSGISPGGGNGNLLQYSYLENPRGALDRGAWSAVVQRVVKSWNDRSNLAHPIFIPFCL